MLVLNSRPWTSSCAILPHILVQRMSSDGYFDGEDEFDADALAQIDAIEAVHLSPKKHTDDSCPVHANNRSRPPMKEDSFDDISFNANESELRRLDAFIKESYEGKPPPVAGPSRTFARTSSNNMVQTTLFGGVAGQQPTSSANKARPDIQRTTTQRNVFGQQARKTKKWDQTAFAKSGIRPPKSKDKGKARADDEDEVEDEPLEFEQFPAPFVSRTSLNVFREDTFGFISLQLTVGYVFFPAVLKTNNMSF
jgi:ATP-dependent DNA helicase MPH1